jgi:hypothetical protein
MPKLTADGYVFDYLVTGSYAFIEVPFTVRVTQGLRGRVEEEVFNRTGKTLTVIFGNALPPSATREIVRFEGEDEPWVSLQTEAHTVRQARQIVDTWLAEHQLQPPYTNSAQVSFVYGQTQWRAVGRQHEMPHAPVDRIDITEGYTTHQAKKATTQSAQVAINGDYHTLGAVVHELFHTVAHASLGEIFVGVGPYLEEAITEYLTCMSMRLFLRRDIQGGLMYADRLAIIRLGITAGAFDERDLINAFFSCDAVPVKKILDYCLPKIG